MKTKTLLLLMITFSLSSCLKEEGEWIKMTVPAGQHETADKPRWSYKRHQEFKLRFNHTVITDTVINQINKVFGMSDGILHQQHSARVGYRWLGEYIGLYGYYRISGEMHWNTDPLYKAQPNEVMTGSLTIGDFKYKACINGNCFEMDRARTGFTMLSYNLYHYFGGRTPAPHDTNVYIMFL